MRHRIQHRALGDLVEGDAADIDLVQQLRLPQHLLDVPGNRLSLAIRVGCEEDVVDATDGARDFIHVALGPVAQFPGHGEVFLRTDRAVLGRKIPNMAETGQNREVRTKILIDRLRFGRGFDDD